MANEFYVRVEGSRQGVFKGETAREKHKGKIPGISFHYNVTSPRDVASGQASGRHRHGPVTMLKRWGPATPQLFQALVTNETLTSVVFEFLKTGPDGEERIYHVVRLTNASVSEIDQFTADETPDPDQDAPELERISFTFQRIEIENTAGKTIATDEARPR